MFYATLSVCAVLVLTDAFTTNQTPPIGPRANLKQPIIRLTGPSRTLSISSMPRDTAPANSSTNYVYDFGGKNLKWSGPRRGIVRETPEGPAANTGRRSSATVSAHSHA